MNPKDMTHVELLSEAMASMLDIGACYEGLEQERADSDVIRVELLRRLDEADALRKENKELRKESFALYARLNEYSYQFIYGGRSGVRTAYVLAAPVLASYRLSHPDGFDAKEIEARS